MRNSFFKYLLLRGVNSASRSELESETLPYTFVSKSQRLRNYRIYGNTVDGESVGDLVETGEHTGEYLVPMTVNDTTTDLYLPEPLKMVGGKAEYVDFREQKQHRVRKNILQNTATTQTINGITFTVNDDGSIDCTRTNTQATGVSVLTINSEELSFTEDCILTGCPAGGSNGSYFLRYIYDRAPGITPQQAFDYGSGVAIPKNKSGDIQIRFASGYNFDGTLTFRPMIRKADITDDAYEPYIENTEIDVTLPALPILEGTNTLSIGTTVQPSKIWIQGNISEMPLVSVKSLNVNSRNLQLLDFENEDLQPDVIPIKKPVLNLNDVSEIENAEIERGVESAE